MRASVTAAAGVERSGHRLAAAVEALGRDPLARARLVAAVGADDAEGAVQRELILLCRGSVALRRPGADECLASFVRAFVDGGHPAEGLAAFLADEAAAAFAAADELRRQGDAEERHTARLVLDAAGDILGRDACPPDPE